MVPDIGLQDIRAIDSLQGFKWAITNLPYRDQDSLGAHLVALGARDGCGVALLTRAEWIVAGKRRCLVHEHPHFAGVVHRRRGRAGLRSALPRRGTISFGLCGRQRHGR